MTNRSVHAFGVIALLGMLVGGCASEGTTGSSYVPPQGLDRIAAGGVEDTLEACKARIPKDATAGQRMLAEQSCSRDQATRR